MLISPLMGPIMGVGLGVGTNDLALLQRGIKNLALAAIISIITSALYFSITPIHNANPELLARTNPSLWDVFIAFFGGLAGIVASTRMKRSNVIPGVAIATALMPPLCTAGFSLAEGNWSFLVGALYLFFINSLFICLGTFLIVKHLRFRKKEFQTKSIERKIIRYIWAIVVITVLPSVYLAYKIVKRTIFETNAKNFIQTEFKFPGSQIVKSSFNITDQKKNVEILVVGREISQSSIDSMEQRMRNYGLDGTTLTVHQGLDAKQEIDLAQIRASILENIFETQKLRDTSHTPVSKLELPIPDLHAEIKSLFPNIASYSLSQTVFYSLDTLTRLDTISLLTVHSIHPISSSDSGRLKDWVAQRIKTDSLKLVIE
jgi:uncharacterized hydrophobic protein (TIGR00271 family)